MTPTRNILLDTSIILDGLSNLKSIGNNANLFVTDVVLRELDGNKKADGVKGYNAREFFRQLNQNPTEMIYGIPSTNQQLLKGDMLSVGEVADGIKIYTITRKWYKARDINDSKIIEIAQDYKLTLKSKDQAQIVRARSVGVEGERLVTNPIVVSKSDKLIFALLLIFFLYVIGIISMDMGGFPLAFINVLAALLFSFLFFGSLGVSTKKFNNDDCTNDPTSLDACAVGGFNNHN